MAGCLVAKAKVAGSNPVFRSNSSPRDHTVPGVFRLRAAVSPLVCPSLWVRVELSEKGGISMSVKLCAAAAALAFLIAPVDVWADPDTCYDVAVGEHCHHFSDG